MENNKYPDIETIVYSPEDERWVVLNRWGHIIDGDQSLEELKSDYPYAKVSKNNYSDKL